jgi:hypothetical protein
VTALLQQKPAKGQLVRGGGARRPSHADLRVTRPSGSTRRPPGRSAATRAPRPRARTGSSRGLGTGCPPRSSRGRSWGCSPRRRRDPATTRRRTCRSPTADSGRRPRLRSERTRTSSRSTAGTGCPSPSTRPSAVPQPLRSSTWRCRRRRRRLPGRGYLGAAPGRRCSGRRSCLPTGSCRCTRRPARRRR